MVNLEKISNLLEKGVENPSFQNDEGKFSAEKWKKEVQVYTGPLLLAIAEKLNEALKKMKDVWQENTFKILKKLEGKQKRIASLQDAKCKLPEPFAINASENDRRHFEGFIVIGPFQDDAADSYSTSVCWGLRWWGTGEKAQNVYKTILNPLNADGKFNTSVFKDGSIGSSAWLFNSLNEKELKKTGLESIAEKVTEDFLQLSSLLSKNEGLFPPPGDRPRKDDVEKAVFSIWSETGQTKINKSDVLKRIESNLKEKRVKLKPAWRKVVEKKLEDWF